MLARGEITAGLVAGVIGGRLVGNPGVVVRDLGGIESPRAGTLTFIRSAGFAHKWASSACAAALVSEGVEVPGHDPRSRALIYVPDADLAVAALLKAVTPKVKAPAGIHPSAVVDASAQIDPSASVGAFCVIGAGVRVGPGVVLGAHSVLEPGATIGPRTVLAPRVTIGARCQVGADCDLASGVVIGTDGFGYRRGPEGDLTKLPHVGRVVIGDRVEIGANACVDRGRFEDTTIGDGTKIDNLVQIGHNVRIGRNVVICGQSGLAGSVVVGDRAVLGAQSGIADNVIVGPRGQVAAQSGVISEVPEGRRVGGSPAVLGWEFIKHVAILRRLASSRAGRGDSRGSAPDRREGTRRPQG